MYLTKPDQDCPILNRLFKEVLEDDKKNEREYLLRKVKALKAGIES